MFKRIVSLFCLFVLVFSVCSVSAELDEPDLSAEEMEFDPEELHELGIVETDGSRTITCTGDLTIGGDNYHKKGKKFRQALEDHDNVFRIALSLR